MKKLLIPLLLAFMISPAFATVESMFYFEHREDYATAQVNTGKEFPELPDDFRQVAYAGYFDTETRGITIERSFVVAAIDPTDPVEEPDNLISPTNVPPEGDWIEVSRDETFVSFDTERFSHLSEDDIGNMLLVTLVAALDNNGGLQEAYWSTGRMISQEGLEPYDPDTFHVTVVETPEVVIPACEGTTKDQVDGALEQLINLTQAALDANIVTFSNNTTRIVNIAAELQLELKIARQVLNGQCEYK